VNDTLAPLFEPWTIGSLAIKNRIVMTSMGGTDLFGWMEKNHFDRAGAEFLLEVAKHDAGLVLPGCQPVYNPMFGQWLHKNKKMYRDLAVWMPVFHATGAKLFVQLTAGFGRSFTISPLMEALYTNPVLRAAAKPVMDLERICAAPSASPNRWSDKVPSREITKPEIDQIIESFAESSRLLKEAGVDGVEVHAVHEGYLLDQFALKYVNKRTDEYGGSLENRYRFAAEIVRAIKRACGDDFPVSIRYSVESKTKGLRQGALPGEQFVEAGRDMAESIEAARYLADAGCDMFNCDNGTYDAWYWAHPPIYMPKNCNLDDVAELRRHIDVPVVCAGRMEPADAAAAIAEKRIDAAGFARPFLADPAWVSKLKAGREADIRPCILCHNGCFNMCHYKGVANDQDLMDSLHLARCAVNAETMQASRHYIKPTSSPKTIHIVGGGIGGMECARVLALRGHRPVIRERGERLAGIRIDSGDLAWNAKQARAMLDEAGLVDTGVVLSNDLDEFAIKSIRDSGAKVASWGVGTKLVTAYDQPALGGVYKLAAKRMKGGKWEPCVKVTGQSSKQTVPGILDVRRYFHESGTIAGDMVFDVLYPVSSERIVDPADELRQKDLSGLRYETLLEPLARAGKVVLDAEARDALVARDRCREQLALLDESQKRIVNPHSYPVGLEYSLFYRRRDLVSRLLGLS